ncbi:MAG TPA: hypothetical protein V6D47_13335 [Oscillatoriaceae cyanobacterium]
MDEHGIAEQRLLFAWLISDEAERQRLLEAHDYDADTAEHLLDLALCGPSYGPNKETEERFQRALLELCLAIARRTEADGTCARTARLLAAHCDDTADREALLKEAAKAGTRMALWTEVYAAERDLALQHQAHRRRRAAMEAYQRALRACMHGSELNLEAIDALEALGRLAEANGDWATVQQAHETWLAHVRASGDRVGLGEAHARLGTLKLDTGDKTGAIAELERAMVLLGEMGQDLPIAKLHAKLLLAYYGLGDSERAMHHLQTLLRLRERHADEALDAELDALLAGLEDL